jgi:hypothetical protein
MMKESLMKKVSFLLVMLAMALALGLAFMSCGGDDGDNNTPGGNTPGGGTPNISAFAGIWNASGGRSCTFTGNNFNYKVNGTTLYSGTFSVSGSTITFIISIGTASGNFTLSETTLVLSNHTWDNSVNGTYTKDTSGGNTPGTPTNPGTGGTLTLTGIPSEHNGKWAISMQDNADPFVIGSKIIGAQNFIASGSGRITPVPISNGSVSIPMWQISGTEENPIFARYSGNDTVSNYVIWIINTGAETSLGRFSPVGAAGFYSITFSNGGVTKSWADADVTRSF